MPSLHLFLLGDFLLTSDDRPVTTLTIARLQSLLAYLVLHRTAPQTRSHLAFLLWPDSTEAQAHSNLRKLLYQLRQMLPQIDDFLSVDRHSLHWRPTHPEAFWTLDVLEFEQALAQAEQAQKGQNTTATQQAYEKAISLYRGDLLPSCYDEWIIPERDRIRQLFFQAVERLITLLEQARNYDAAIKAAQQLLRYDPLHEATYRHLMRFYALNGDRAAALRTYHTCATLLERELGIEPAPATRQAYESLLQMDTPSPAKAAPDLHRSAGSPLIGRKIQWGQLQGVWRRAADGHPCMVVLSGEAGVGKTRLSEELAAWTERQGITTASAHCYAAEGNLAYAPVATWFRATTFQSGLLALDKIWLAEVIRLVPELQAKRPDLSPPNPMLEGWQRQHFFEALAQALLAQRQPLLLLLDDLQWCDNETLEWVHYLLRFKPPVRLLIVGTVRAEEMLPGHPLVSFLGTLQREDLMTEIVLESLNSTETATLAEHIVSHKLNATLISNLYRETEGNPLFIVEMLRAEALVQQNMPSHEMDKPASLLTPSTSTLPPTVQTILATRLSQLSSSARELTGLAAVMGRAFSFEVLAHASGVSEESLVQGLDELWQRRIVREQGGDAYDFSHDKLREVAYASLSSVRRRFLHRRVAEALEEIHQPDLDTVSSQIAAHYEEAGLLEQAIPYYQLAGEVAAKIYANTEAISMFRHGLALFEKANARHALTWEKGASIYEHLGDILDATGQHPEARQAYQQAQIYVPPQRYLLQARLYRKIAVTLQHPPNPAKALQSYKEAEDVLERVEIKAADPAWQHEWIQTRVEQLQPLFILARTQEMTRVIQQTQTVIEKHGTAEQRALFFRHIALRDILQNHYVASEETVTWCRLALETSQQTGQLHLVGLARFGFGYCLLLSDDLDLAEEQLQAARTLSEQIGDMELNARSRAFLPLIFRKRGQVEEVRRYVECEKLYTSVTNAHHAWVAWRDGNIEEAEKYAQAALDEWQHQHYAYTFQWTGLWPLIGVALTQAKLTEAIDYVRMLLAPTQQQPPEALRITLEAVLQSWEAGQPELARSRLEETFPLAQTLGYL